MSKGSWILCAVLMSAVARAEDALVSPTQSAEESEARQRFAEDSFLNIIAPQNMDFDNAVRSKAAAPRAFKPLAPGNLNQTADNPYVLPLPEPQTSNLPSQEGGERSVTLSLIDYARFQETIRNAREEKILTEGPAVILGASEYSGKAIPGALALNLKLTVILGAGNKWKTVPLVGEDVVLTAARVNNTPIPTARQNGYLVWATRQTGEILINMEILVPSRGPKGSIEYDFFAPKTPVTRFSCFFPTAGLEPRIADARQSTAAARDDGTFFEAVLKPTSRIHFVGYKDIGADEDAAAGLFTETLNLVSIDEGTIELFSVFRYTILYAGAKEFLIEIPEGMSVVSAEGESAFSFVLEESGDKTILRGETAFPVRNNFEVSLRLKRRNQNLEAAVEIPLPHALNAEREQGYIAVEVPGKLQIEETRKQNVTLLDVRQLPEEMVRSAVSPIVKAYRYHSANAQVFLSAKKLPEKEPESLSIDRIRAFSVISKDGKMLTDIRIRMRNRLRPSLSMRIPKDSKLLSVHLDGEAVRPSREGTDLVIMPLKRSEGGDAPSPFALQIVLESKIDEPGLFGRRDLVLPSVDLPVSSAEWTVYAPASNTYSALEGEIEPQVEAGEAAWYASPFSSAPVRTFVGAGDGEGDTPADAAGIAAVRIDLPKTGSRLEWTGYWINADKPVGVHFYFVRSRLLLPIGVFAALLFACSGWIFFSRRPMLRATRAILPAAAVYPLYKTLGIFGIAGGLLLFIVAVISRRKGLAAFKTWIKAWSATFGPRFKERDREETKLNVGRILAGVSICVLGFFLLLAAAAFINLMLTPL